uniref:Uncharacterized protein n=1 Tax=Rhizophora mucronata TaxID=61149 RepID=A0A2P2NKS5_RHIMU
MTISGITCLKSTSLTDLQLTVVPILYQLALVT